MKYEKNPAAPVIIVHRARKTNVAITITPCPDAAAWLLLKAQGHSESY